MRFSTLSALALGLATSALSQNLQQSLSSSLAPYAELSTFKGILDMFPGLVPAVLDGKTSDVTVLVPSNKAISNFLASSNVTDLSAIPVAQLQVVLKYHVMDAKLKGENFTVPGGITIPTVLRDRLYNNRTAGPELAKVFGNQATGQVLFVQKDPISAPSTFRVRVRQSATGPNVNLRAGLAQTATLSAVDGTWEGGSFQVIDTVLSPPMPCSTTIKSVSEALASLDNALNRSGLYPTLDAAPNVTCLAPTTAAFKAAGSPDASLEAKPLGDALLFHTLPEVTYSNFLRDGQVFNSLGGLPVTVRIIQGSIYFNDAKVVSPNVLTNNGLIHVLDKVMSANGTPPASATTTTGAPVSTRTSSASAALSRNEAGVGLVALLGAAFAAFL